MSQYHLEFTPESNSTLEGMKIASRVIFHGPKAVLLWLQTLMTVILVPAGFVAVIMVVKALTSDDAMFQNAAWVPALFILGGGAGLVLNTLVYQAMADAAIKSRFGRHLRVSIGPEAFSFAGGQSEWRLVWGDVDAVVKGKRVIAVCTGAVVLPVPIAAFETSEIGAEAFEHMKQWHKEAVS